MKTEVPLGVFAAEVREEILDEVAPTNYAGLARPFLDKIYSMPYQQKMLGHNRSDAHEQMHGIADSLISVLAHRSQDIVGDPLDRRDTVRARTA